GKGVVLGLMKNGVSAPADKAPRAKFLLHPERELVPYAAYSESLGVTARGKLQHGEGSNLRAMFGLLDEAELYAQFCVRQAERTGARSARSVDRAVGWINGSEGQND